MSKLVDLPGIKDFPPNDNANPQKSDIYGKYAYMVYPDTDYYIVAKMNGYLDYKSPTIEVQKEIVKLDIVLNPKDPKDMGVYIQADK